ncbi:MAG: hypothetical protein HN509_02065 [Halobacteriovoraceae bacterium]|jgi:hypothetical protein|nr:hypothetical protein [Halobacteriovoraceae bacterium]
MKKTYQFKVKNKTPERQVDSIKHEVKKYISRERKKKLPDDMDYWDFDCKIGNNEEVAAAIHHSKISEMIDQVAATENESFYLEILAKPAKRMKK